MKNEALFFQKLVKLKYFCKDILRSGLIKIKNNFLRGVLDFKREATNFNVWCF